MKRFLFVSLLFLGFSLQAQDAQWRGPERNGIYPDSGLLKEWPAGGPELLFEAEGLGRSYSSIVASDLSIFVSGVIDSHEYLTALDYNGNLLWQKSYGEAWDQSFPDARCTPLVDGNRVYVLSGKDNLVCFDTGSGDFVWEVDIHQTYKSVWDMFGVSESLLLVDDKIILTPCGNETTVIALNKINGELIWKSESLGIPRSNGSPVLFTNDTLGIKQIIAMNQTHVLGVDPENGKIYWSYHYNKLNEKNENTTILANSPLFHFDEILISNGWDEPLEMLELSNDGKSVSKKYTNYTFDNQNHGMVRLGDFVYGSNFLERNFGKWVCMRWDNGEIMYVEDWNSKGPVISADGMLYLMDEKKGFVGLAEANPDGLEIVSSFKVKQGKGPFWARPAIYDGILFIRHGDYLLAYSLIS